MAKVKWKRRRMSSHGTCYEVVNDVGLAVIHVHQKENCRFWYVYVGVGQDEADGTRFRTLWEAKEYAEGQIANGRASLVMDPAELVACAECQEEFEYQELTDGRCDECNREECCACEGSGWSDDYDDKGGAKECEDCGGDGVV